MQPDFRSSNHDTLVMLWPVSAEAELWCDDNLGEPRTVFDGGIAVEPRYFSDLAEAILADGLVLQDAETGRIAAR